MEIKDILKGEFKFNKWNGYKAQADEFENDLSEFGTFVIYDNLESFENDHEFYEEHHYNSLEGIDKEKPILIGEANTFENPVHFEAIENIKNESDLINFINDVLSDLGEVTHSTGIKNEYEVVGLA